MDNQRINTIGAEAISSKSTSQNSQLQSAQFGQSPQSSDAGVTGVGDFFQVINHLVSMVWSERNLVGRILLNFQQFLHHCIHVCIATQVVIFKEIAFSISPCVPEVYKVNAGPQRFGHGWQVIVWVCAKRSGTETDAVALVGNSIDDELNIFNVLYNPW
jgi:hypothetical protein